MLIDESKTNDILAAAIKVHRYFGNGYLEKVYEKALAIELRNRGFIVDVQRQMDIHYYEHFVGSYFADLVVNNEVLIELKATNDLKNEHTAQVIHYLKATDLKVGLLLNFGKEKLQIKRYVN